MPQVFGLKWVATSDCYSNIGQQHQKAVCYWVFTFFDIGGISDSAITVSAATIDDIGPIEVAAGSPRTVARCPHLNLSRFSI